MVLKPIHYEDIKQYDPDYYRRSKDSDIPQDVGWIGVFRNDSLVSYFAISDLGSGGLLVQRGYVLPEFRSTTYRGSVWFDSMTLLEQTAKTYGYNYIEFDARRNPLAYARKFKSLGYRPTAIKLTKNLRETHV